MSKLMPPSIHVCSKSAVLDLIGGPVSLGLRVRNGSPAQVLVQLLSFDGALLGEWMADDPTSLVLCREGTSLALHARQGKVLEDRLSGGVAVPCADALAVLRCHVDDPAHDGCWHACHMAVLLHATGWEQLERKKAVLYGDFADVANSVACPDAARTIRIVARNIVPGDAVSNFCLGLASVLRGAGYAPALYAHDNHAAYAGIVAQLGALFAAPQATDVVLYNYSIGDDFFPEVVALPCVRNVLFFHNVTPGHWFAPYAPVFADRLETARRQFALFGQFDMVITNSVFSLDQIRPYVRPDASTLVHPPYFSLQRVQGKETPVESHFPASHSILWIGRIAPHKRPDLALAVFDELVRSGVDASLTFVGGGRYDFPGFAAHMDACLARLEPATRERVLFLQDLSDEQLTWLYRNAALLLCTSAHEGYCMPLAEAAACGLPVAAMPQPAVLETLNGGGIVLEEEPTVAAQRIKAFLIGADEEERRRAVPVLKPLPTDDLIRLVAGDARCR